MTTWYTKDGFRRFTEAHGEPPITGRCSKCHENTTFEMDPYEKELMSTCCWRPMYDAPDEP